MIKILEPNSLLLAQKMMILLNKLIEPATSESLERLQLIEINLDEVSRFNLSFDSSWHQVELRKIADEGGRFLTISGKLVAKDQPLLHLSIKYFLRGEKIFYRHKTKVDEHHLKEGFQAITSKDIKEALAQIGLDNELFYNKELMHLNGHKHLPVPNQLVFAWALSEGLMKIGSISNMQFIFLGQLWQEHAFSVSHALLEESGEIVFWQNERAVLKVIINA